MFNWNRYLMLAKRLAASEDEADLRTAISRAYYAAFHIAIEYCLTVRVRIPYAVVRDGKSDTSYHSRVIGALRSHANLHVREAGERLVFLRRWRNSADYRLPFDGNVRAVAHQAIVSAESMIDDLARSCQGM